MHKSKYSATLSLNNDQFVKVIAENRPTKTSELKRGILISLCHYSYLSANVKMSAAGKTSGTGVFGAKNMRLLIGSRVPDLSLQRFK
jgi:hypothetical protein